MYQESYPEETPFAGEENFSAFYDTKIRLGFIRKVYGLLMGQLLITLAFISLFFFVTEIKTFSAAHREMFWVAFAIAIVCILVLGCCPEMRRRSPFNYIFLFLFTIAEGFLLGSAASHYNAEEVLWAIGICALVCLSVSLFATQTKYDLTTCNGFVFVSLLILICFGFIAILFPSKIMVILYSSIAALLFSFYLIIDTQLILGGKHQYSISPEEYIFATLNLYLDIISIFMNILTIIGMANR